MKCEMRIIDGISSNSNGIKSIGYGLSFVVRVGVRVCGVFSIIAPEAMPIP